MNTVQEEEEIKYIPEGAKCKPHVELYSLHYPFTGAQENKTKKSSQLIVSLLIQALGNGFY